MMKGGVSLSGRAIPIRMRLEAIEDCEARPGFSVPQTNLPCDSGESFSLAGLQIYNQAWPWFQKGPKTN